MEWAQTKTKKSTKQTWRMKSTNTRSHSPGPSTRGVVCMNSSARRVLSVLLLLVSAAAAGSSMAAAGGRGRGGEGMPPPPHP